MSTDSDSNKRSSSKPPPTEKSKNLTSGHIKESNNVNNVNNNLVNLNNSSSSNINNSNSNNKKGIFGKLFSDKNNNSNNNSNVNIQSPPVSPMTSDNELGFSPLNSRPPSRQHSVNKKNQQSNQHSQQPQPPASNKRTPSEGERSNKTPSESGKLTHALLDLLPAPLNRKSSASSHGNNQNDKHGGDNNSTTSLLKKYGICDKVAIGRGATAVVRLAHRWDRSDEKLFAVKEFRKRRKNETEKEYVKKLTSEFCISSTLHHNNIIETVDLVKDENNHWCEVMEYCPGGDLYAAIKKGNLGEKFTLAFFKQILNGIAYLHSMGVAHRDIKPENLLLDGRGSIKVR